MREIVFLRRRFEIWKQYEKIINNARRQNPDDLAALYIDITQDLSFAQAHYPNSKTTAYLNQLSLEVHDALFPERKEPVKRITHFWKHELPAVLSENLSMLYLSLTLFLISMGIGYLSSTQNSDFARVILGDNYVNMTLENIEKGDPLAVYKKARQMDMFLGITFNNIRVSFVVFIMGLLTSFGSAFILLQNGIMVGAFMQFFAQFGLLFKSFSVIYIHGALELSAIVIAGAAGLTLSKGFLFPGTHTRLHSFMKSAKDGLKIIIGLIPVFIAAGFLESFVTRYTEMPVFLSMSIILGSFFFVGYYFFYFPKKLNNKI